MVLELTADTRYRVEFSCRLIYHYMVRLRFVTKRQPDHLLVH
jgi:hypothetical protein